MCKPKNCVDSSVKLTPIWAKGMPSMQSSRPVIFSRLFGVFNILNFFLFGLRDNLFTQNHSYNYLS